MAEKLIFAEALIEHFCEMKNLGFEVMPFSFVENSIENAPAVDAELTIHARWQVENDIIRCSNCGMNALASPWARGQQVGTPYCSWCGARMDEKEE